VHPLAALQTEYSLWARDCEAEILPACRELGHRVYGVRAARTRAAHRIDQDRRRPAGSDRRRRHPRFQPENLVRNAALVAQLEAMAKRNRIMPAQLALAWLLAQGDDIVPIPGRITCAIWT
jgi:aryl-alcohol dehydrogenase-like predicted oxidoreductase